MLRVSQLQCFLLFTNAWLMQQAAVHSRHSLTLCFLVFCIQAAAALTHPPQVHLPTLLTRFGPRWQLLYRIIH